MPTPDATIRDPRRALCLTCLERRIPLDLVNTAVAGSDFCAAHGGLAPADRAWPTLTSSVPWTFDSMSVATMICAVANSVGVGRVTGAASSTRWRCASVRSQVARAVYSRVGMV